MADHDAAKAVVARRAAAKGPSSAVPTAAPTMSPGAAHGLGGAAPAPAPEFDPRSEFDADFIGPARAPEPELPSAEAPSVV